MGSQQRSKIIIGFLVIVLFAVSAMFAANYFTSQDNSPLDEGPVIVNEEIVGDQEPIEPVPYKVERLITGLEVPWSIVFPTNERWLISERGGQVRIVQDGKLRVTPLITFGEVSSADEEGLMGLAVDPSYSTNKLIYACFATAADDGLINKVVRFEDQGNVTSQPQTILDNIPAARFHAGCRLGFGPDGMLYITTGDATDPDIAQDQTSLGGKILRINADGSIPDDNPDPNSPIWSLGHRNPQGLDWHPVTGELFATEHGPSGNDGPNGGDEVNIIEKGQNYGWPIVSHEETDARFTSPLLVFTPAVAPSGATFYGGNQLPQFKGDFFFAALKGEGIIHVDLDDDDSSKVAMYEKLPGINVGRIRDVVEGRDGAIYFLTSNRDGRGQPAEDDDAVYRIIAEQQE